MNKPDLSLILPCYNESEHFTKSAEFILSTLKKTNYTFELIFVEDKSKDETPLLIRKFIQRHSKENLQVIWHSKNSGRGQTVTNGIQKALGIYVGYMDIDCEISPVYIADCLKLIKSGFDVVCGERRYEVSLQGLSRAVISKTYSSLVRLVLDVAFSDTEAGYKFFIRKKILAVLPKVGDNGWFWDTEVVMRSHLTGLKIGFLPVEFRRRTDKTSTVHLVRDAWDYLVKLFRFSWQLRRESYASHVTLSSFMHLYWQSNSAAFTGQYSTFFGLPLSPVGWFLKVRQQKIVTWLHSLPGKTFLSAGCGSGMVVVEAIKQGRFAIGLDYSPQMLELARKNLSRFPERCYSLLLGNAIKMPIAANSIDILLASGLTDYLTRNEAELFMKEIGRVLKPEGYAILTFPKASSPLKFLRRGFGLWIRQKFLKLPPMESDYTEKELHQLFRLAGIYPEIRDQVFSTMWLIRCKKL